MSRPASPTVTAAEQAILEVLWDLSEGTVREVTDRLGQRKPLAYNTVLTMLGVLEKKGLVHASKDGRAFVYRPAVTRDEVRRRALTSLMTQFFDGSPEALALHLLKDHDVDTQKLEALRARVSAAREQGGS